MVVTGLDVLALPLSTAFAASNRKGFEVKKLLIGASLVFAASFAFAGGGAIPSNGKPVDPASLQKLLDESGKPDVQALLHRVVDENIAKGRLCYLPDKGISAVGATVSFEGKTVRCERTLAISQDDHLIPGRAEWVDVKD